MKLTREFTKREKLLLLLLAVLLLLGFYYKMVYFEYNTSVREYPARVAEAESVRDAALVRYTNLEKMKTELEEMRGDGKQMAKIPAYDNSQNIMKELNRMMASTREYNVTLQPLEQEGHTVRRKLHLGFIAPSYEGAKGIVKELKELPYRCLITSMTCVADGDAAGIKSGSVRVQMDITFFESSEKTVVAEEE